MQSQVMNSDIKYQSESLNMPVNNQSSIESTLDKSFEELVTKILATEDDASEGDSLTTQLSLAQELLDNLSMGNCFENGIPPWKQTSVPDVSGMSSAQLIQEALAYMRQNKNLQGLPHLQRPTNPYTPEGNNGPANFSNPILCMAQGEEESLYSGVGSPRSSVAGSYSSGDEVVWPNMAFPREDSEVSTAPTSTSHNSPQFGNQYTDFQMDNLPLLNIKPPKPCFESRPNGSASDSAKDLAPNFTSNRASPSVMTEGVGVFPDHKPQPPSGIPNFRNVNNIASENLGRSSPRPMGACSVNGYPPKMPKQMTDHFPFVPGPTFNNKANCQAPRYQGGPRQGAYPSFYNQKVDAQIAGFPRNIANNRFHYDGKNQASMWMKRNQPSNLTYQQRGNFAGNYSGMSSSNMIPVSPYPMGEISSAIRECQEQLQNLEKERRRTETELVRMNPGKRISSSNTIAVPPLPPNPSSMDQLITEEYREHSRMTALLSKVGGLNARVLHPNIEMCLDKWMSAIQAIEAHRTAELCQGKGMQMTGNGPVADKIQELVKATSAARTKLWCALQLSKERHIPPLQKDILTFVPNGVHIV